MAARRFVLPLDKFVQMLRDRPNGQLSLANPSLVGAMSTSQRAVTSCVWGVKAGMVHVWVAGKTV